jgi:hypothetical protein
LGEWEEDYDAGIHSPLPPLRIQEPDEDCCADVVAVLLLFLLAGESGVTEGLTLLVW